MNIRIHIERLVLDGISIPPDQRQPLQAAVEGELARLLGEGGLAYGLDSGGALFSVRAGAMQLTGDTNPTTLGQQIAQAVYGGIGR